MANGMGSLMVGATGLRSSQTALNTTAHNLSNVNTEGYTRQQITFADSTYANVFSKSLNKGKYGLGVDIDAISRIRNEFIDRSYRVQDWDSMKVRLMRYTRLKTGLVKCRELLISSISQTFTMQ